MSFTVVGPCPDPRTRLSWRRGWNDSSPTFEFRSRWCAVLGANAGAYRYRAPPCGCTEAVGAPRLGAG